MAQPFAPVNRKSFPAVPLRTTKDARYWKSFKVSSEILQPATVTDVEFCPATSNTLISTSGTQISVISVERGQIMNRITSFKEHVYGGSFRKDSALIAAGGEEAIVRVFDAKKRNLLRSFSGHNGAVHSTKFSHDGIRVMSGGDDHVVRCWDLPTESCLFELVHHRDFVRSQACCPSPHLWATGSYDKKMRLFDLRSKEVIFELNHDSLIEDILVFPSGTLAVSVGGNSVRVWDLFTGGRMLANLQNHSRAAMCASLDGSGSRLITGGLDQQVKVYNTSSFEMVASVWIEGEVVSISLSQDEHFLACGLSNGKLILKRHSPVSSLRDGEVEEHGRDTYQVVSASTIGTKRTDAVPGTLRYFFRGQNQKARPEDAAVPKPPKIKLRKHDKMLQSFRYSDALDAAMETGQTAFSCAVIEELVSRNGLKTALSGRDEESLLPVLQLLTKNMQNPYYSHTLIGLTKRSF
ncbi:U3 small nucleolar RNA-associated protein 15 [Galdieria sulphuraria]|nr:U3 small nucleolar RNA-associated protein 15 [Galdieria sulphuraria]